MYTIWMLFSVPLLALCWYVREVRPRLFKAAIIESAIQGVLVVWGALLDSGGVSLMAHSMALLPANLLVLLAQFATFAVAAIFVGWTALSRVRGRVPRGALAVGVGLLLTGAYVGVGWSIQGWIVPYYSYLPPGLLEVLAVLTALGISAMYLIDRKGKASRIGPS